MPHSPGLLNDFCVIYYVCKYFRRLAVSSSITLTLSGFEHNSRLLRRSFFLQSWRYYVTSLIFGGGTFFDNWHFILFFQIVVSSFLWLAAKTILFCDAIFAKTTQSKMLRRTQTNWCLYFLTRIWLTPLSVMSPHLWCHDLNFTFGKELSQTSQNITYHSITHIVTFQPLSQSFSLLLKKLIDNLQNDRLFSSSKISLLSFCLCVSVFIFFNTIKEGVKQYCNVIYFFQSFFLCLTAAVDKSLKQQKLKLKFEKLID